MAALRKSEWLRWVAASGRLRSSPTQVELAGVLCDVPQLPGEARLRERPLPFPAVCRPRGDYRGHYCGCRRCPLTTLQGRSPHSIAVSQVRLQRTVRIRSIGSRRPLKRVRSVRGRGALLCLEQWPALDSGFLAHGAPAVRCLPNAEHGSCGNHQHEGQIGRRRERTTRELD